MYHLWSSSSSCRHITAVSLLSHCRGVVSRHHCHCVITVIAIMSLPSCHCHHIVAVVVVVSSRRCHHCHCIVVVAVVVVLLLLYSSCPFGVHGDAGQ